MFSYQVVSMRV